ncbi:hypothetical protein PROFUN_05220 [Planoprotostelium fungivorum]|uniref:Uncharacterized protein n=1 Tax=Planoprotostelium fungivorum TaxID=1890364 RepID=A0A2P6NRH6_9EUKA|nr:hypothetical protein PROFUN_05220 [Planoprotostelium fungivorum]
MTRVWLLLICRAGRRVTSRKNITTNTRTRIIRSEMGCWSRRKRNTPAVSLIENEKTADYGTWKRRESMGKIVPSPPPRQSRDIKTKIPLLEHDFQRLHQQFGGRLSLLTQ